jgi:hypothetical protein
MVGEDGEHELESYRDSGQARSLRPLSAAEKQLVLAERRGELGIE